MWACSKIVPESADAHTGRICIVGNYIFDGFDEGGPQSETKDSAMMLRMRVSIARSVLAGRFCRTTSNIQFCAKSTSLSKFLMPLIESYEGETTNGKWHGKGTITYKDGSIFEGSFVNGKMEGRGIMITAGGKTFIGDYKDNKLWNGSGVDLLGEGAFYEGEVVQGKYDGKGRFHKNGFKYEGEFQRGMYHGRGLEIHADGSAYGGFYMHGKHHGLGIHVNSRRIRYSGEFQDGMRHGKGSLSFPNGKTFDGIFFAGKIISGKGYWELGELGTAFEGEWVNGERTTGVYTNFDVPSERPNTRKHSWGEKRGYRYSAGSEWRETKGQRKAGISDAANKLHGYHKEIGEQQGSPDQSSSRASVPGVPTSNSNYNGNAEHSLTTSAAFTSTGAAASTHNHGNNDSIRGSTQANRVEHKRNDRDAPRK